MASSFQLLQEVLRHLGSFDYTNLNDLVCKVIDSQNVEHLTSLKMFLDFCDEVDHSIRVTTLLLELSKDGSDQDSGEVASCYTSLASLYQVKGMRATK